MRFRSRGDPHEIVEEVGKADVVFLLPHQAEQLAPKSVDLFVNISSLHEMTMAQVEAYFAMIDKVTRGHLYTKQWKSFTNPKDRITIAEGDYPYPASWRRVLSRTARAQPAFFEAVYRVE